MNIIDKCANTSNLRNVEVAPKIIFGLLSLSTCLFSSNLYVPLIVFTTMTFITITISGVAIKTYLKLIKIPFSFLIISIATILISVTKESSGIISVRVINYFLSVTRENLFLGFQLFLKSLASVACLYFISLTTPLFEIIHFLNRIKTPKFITEIMLIMYNFIFILLETMETIKCAQNIRLGYKNLKTSYNSTTTLAASLFIKAFKHAEDLNNSMEARLFNGEIRMLKINKKCPVGYYVFSFIYLACIVIISMPT